MTVELIWYLSGVAISAALFFRRPNDLSDWLATIVCSTLWPLYWLFTGIFMLFNMIEESAQSVQQYRQDQAYYFDPDFASEMREQGS